MFTDLITLCRKFFKLYMMKSNAELTQENRAYLEYLTLSEVWKGDS